MLRIGDRVEMRSAPGVYGRVFAVRSDRCDRRHVLFASADGQVFDRAPTELRRFAC